MRFTQYNDTDNPLPQRAMIQYNKILANEFGCPGYNVPIIEIRSVNSNIYYSNVY